MKQLDPVQKSPQPAAPRRTVVTKAPPKTKVRAMKIAVAVTMVCVVVGWVLAMTLLGPGKKSEKQNIFGTIADQLQQIWSGFSGSTNTNVPQRSQQELNALRARVFPQFSNVNSANADSANVNTAQ